MSRTAQTSKKRWWSGRKRYGVIALIFVAIFLLNRCLSSKPSPFSARPVYVRKGVVLQPVMVDGLDADFFYVPSAGPRKALVLLGGSDGGRYWSYQPAFINDLIDQGFCVLSLPYFGSGNLPADLRGIPLEYFSKAFHWLSLQKGSVKPNEYGLVGVSRGAELALLLAARHPEVKVVVAIAPGSVVFPGPPTGILDIFSGEHSAWSEKGKELTFVPIPYNWSTLSGMISGNRTRMFENALLDTERVKAAAIPVEKIQGPVFLASYTRDQVWPSVFMSRQIINRLHSYNFRFPYQHKSYVGGHSEWSKEPCRTDIITFLKTQFGD
jgi:pimeloyl-ACP methyl ester carboxylesterase